MSVSINHVFKQGPCIGTLFGVAMGALLPKKGGEVEAPGPKLSQVIPPRAPSLVSDYIAWCGGREDPVGVPPHLFPQWGFPPMAKALGNLPWPMTKVINQGCRLEVNGPLPAGEPLQVTTWLASVDEDEHKVRITTRILTGTKAQPDLVVADVHAVVPLRRKKGGTKREPPTVPTDSHEIGRHALAARAGLDFALLTGDFNPIHWIPPYA